MTACDVCKGSFSDDQLVRIGGKNVCAGCKPELVMNLKSGIGATPRIDPLKAKEIKSRISRLNLWSFALAIPGLALHGFALQMGTRAGAQGAPAAGALQLVAILLVIAGFCFYARMKGRSAALGLLGLLSCLGLIILNYLPKNCHNCRASASHNAKECSACGAPV